MFHYLQIIIKRTLSFLDHSQVCYNEKQNKQPEQHTTASGRFNYKSSHR